MDTQIVRSVRYADITIPTKQIEHLALWWIASLKSYAPNISFLRRLRTT